MAGAAADGNVTLVSLTIFQTHEWIFKPDVYFKCQGEERRYLPDVENKVACTSLLDKSLGR
jgi:hypothetical protein